MPVNRTTAIVGAGAVLDFDFSYDGAVYPSTSEITKIVSEIKVQGLDVEESDIVTAVYSHANKVLNDIYKKRNLKNLHYEINFEELYFLLESMLMQNVEYLVPEAIPIINTVVKIVPELNKYPNVEIVRGLIAIIHEIMEIVDGYDSHFKKYMKEESWYQEFWQDDSSHRWDVFTFNYDTTIENSMSEYEDGYAKLSDDEHFESFIPVKLIENREQLSTIQHLHGCIYYAESAPWTRRFTHGNRDMFKYQSVKECQEYIGLQSNDENQAREGFINSPILIGLRKLDKMTSLPHSIYHANLASTLQKNKGLLIVGYSFGDLYVNQMLQRRILMHGDAHRMIIIDSFPEFVNSKGAFYRYLIDYRPRLYVFLRPFIDYSFDDHFQLCGIEFISHDEPIYSTNHNCMLLIGGVKKAICQHKELIRSFLDEDY